MSFFTDMMRTSARRYGGAGIREQLRQGANSVSGMSMADAQQLGFLPWANAPGIRDFRMQRAAGGNPLDGTMSVGVFTGDFSAGDSNSGAIDPEALAAYLDQQGYQIGQFEGAPGQNWRWLEDAQGGYVPGFEPQNYYTDDRTAALLGMAALGGVAGGAINAGVGMGASAGGAEASLFGGALPEFGAGLGTVAADITGSSLLTGGTAGAGAAGFGSIGLPAGLTLGGASAAPGLLGPLPEVGIPPAPPADITGSVPLTGGVPGAGEAGLGSLSGLVGTGGIGDLAGSTPGTPKLPGTPTSGAPGTTTPSLGGSLPNDLLRLLMGGLAIQQSDKYREMSKMPTLGEFQGMPGYAAAMDAVNRRQAASGTLRSGTADAAAASMGASLYDMLYNQKLKQAAGYATGAMGLMSGMGLAGAGLGNLGSTLMGLDWGRLLGPMSNGTMPSGAGTNVAGGIDWAGMGTNLGSLFNTGDLGGWGSNVFDPSNWPTGPGE